MILQNLDAVSEKIAKMGFLFPNFFRGPVTNSEDTFSIADEPTSYGKFWENRWTDSGESVFGKTQRKI